MAQLSLVVDRGFESFGFEVAACIHGFRVCGRKQHACLVMCSLHTFFSRICLGQDIEYIVDCGSESLTRYAHSSRDDSTVT